MLTNSSIRLWLDFNGTLPSNLPSCQSFSQYGTIETVDVPCRDVCTYNGSFAESTQNIITCGLWATVFNPYFVKLKQWGMTSTPLKLPADPPALPPGSTELFQSVGLGHMDFAQYDATTDNIASYIGHFYPFKKDVSGVDANYFKASCAKDALFPMQENPEASYRNSIWSLNDCIAGMCASPKINPDLGGIGVLLSLMIQSGIVVVAALGFSILETRRIVGNEKRERHTTALIMALIEFHKYQCYFASSVQIAGLILFTRFVDKGYYFPRLDTLLLGLLAMTGAVPITGTLAHIARYGRQSWYLITLSFLTLSLSTVSLRSYSKLIKAVEELGVNGFQTYNDGMVLFQSFCGKNTAPRIADQWFMKLWPYDFIIIWATCGLWVLACVAKKSSESNVSSQKYKGLGIMLYITEGVQIWESKIYKKIAPFVLILWITIYAYQFFLLYHYATLPIIPTDWSFGQIVAVTIWIPSVVEFIYLEISK